MSLEVRVKSIIREGVQNHTHCCLQVSAHIGIISAKV